MLNNKIVLVTGASRGIGMAIAFEMAKQGARVFGTATTEKGAQEITQAFEQAGLPGKGIKCNVIDITQVHDMLSGLEKQGEMPAILVNNAGITRDNLILRMKEEEWLEVINTNLNAVFNLTKECVKPMIKTKWGRIINISSVVAYTGNPGQANYCAAKAGMIGFSKALALEIATRGITVNVIAPGFIETDMTRKLTETQREMILTQVPMKRIGEPIDIAKMAAYLASDDASYITGQTIHINGGLYTS